MNPALAAAFGAAMADLGPFNWPPFLAVAVSGGADSLALALLADEWARQRHGSILALIVDHGLRAAAAAEARATAMALTVRSVPSRIIALELPSGPATQDRARRARHAALAHAAREAGAAHLLFGHHARDQAETVTMRAARGARGLHGMAAVVAGSDVLMLRPLLPVEPHLLRDFLRAAGCGWIEDPSNVDPRFERVRTRARVEAGLGAKQDVIREQGHARKAEMRATAWQLARHAEIHAEGYALWRADAIPPEVLAALLRVVGGRLYAPDRQAVGRLAERLRRTTLGGVQVTKWRDAWLFAREPASCAPAVAALPGQVWDGRFRMVGAPDAADQEPFHKLCRLGALGSGAAAFRKCSGLPSLILQSLPAVYNYAAIIAIPHLGYGWPCALAFCPPGPAAPLAFSSHPFV